MKFTTMLGAGAAAVMFTLALSGEENRVPAETASAATSIPSLAQTYKSDFRIGTAFDFVGQRPSPAQLDMIRYQYNIVTPENSMKPDSVHPAEDRWTFNQADRLVEFCQQNNIAIMGHTLCWHGQTGKWFFQNEDGTPAPKEKVIERLRTHITTEVTHFKGKILGWDVVNEAISDRPSPTTENLRGPWFQAIGPEFLNIAFDAAHKADPKAELYYNDYSIERGPKHASSLLLLKRLISQGVPITAVGIQGHWSLNYLPYEDIEKAIEEYHALGLKVNVSELDITITGQGGGQLTATGAPPASAPTSQPTTGPGRRRGGFGRGPTRPPTKEELDVQAQAYAKLFAIFERHKEAMGRVTVWGINDAVSWRPGQSPLLFDAQDKPKPAFQAIIEAKK